MKKLKKIIELRKHPAFSALMTLLIIAVVASVLVEYSEEGINDQFKNFWDSIWWVFVTISTVGYGDKIPVTPVGRVLGVILMFFGVAMLSVVTATISSIFVSRMIREGKGLQNVKIEKHVLLCGWNVQAEQILATLDKEKDRSAPIVLINQLSEEDIDVILSKFSNLTIKFVRGDFTRENILTRANVQNAVSAIILPDNSSALVKSGDERTILATLSLKTLNPKIKVYAHILERDNISHLRKAKADEVIVSDAYTGFLLANYVSAPGVPQLIEQIFSANASNKIIRRQIPGELAGHKYSELSAYYKERYSGILIGLGQITEPFNLTEILSDDYSYLDSYIMQKFKEAGRGMDGDEQIKIVVNPSPDLELKRSDFYLSIESSQHE
ncbi:MAG: TrkA family potassium uptake protein [Calditrichaceae bacterium]